LCPSLNASSFAVAENGEIMDDNNMLKHLNNILENRPDDWLNLTTHRLDIYHEELAKGEFIEQFEKLLEEETINRSDLSKLPTAYDYIRLGHPLSSVLEWAIAQMHGLKSEQVISFASNTPPILAVLRKNLFSATNTRIVYTGELPGNFDPKVIREVYGYHFDLIQIDEEETLSDFNGSTILLSKESNLSALTFSANIDFVVCLLPGYGSIILVNGDKNADYISEIQHVRRRETIAMTPADCFSVLKSLAKQSPVKEKASPSASHKQEVISAIKRITEAQTSALIGSSGLSIQYAIMMGLIHHAMDSYPGKAIKIIVPPNCYGGTNDQARRVAACIKQVEVMDLPVDGDHDMVQSTDMVLEQVAKEDAVPLIIAEIPTNPRVEVPNLDALQNALSKERKTTKGTEAIPPVFILDQTFCPNVHFLGEGEKLASVQTIAYVSGSKFPSGGRCTAGYCVANQKAEALLPKIEQHLILCDNEATPLQMEILAEQLPSMNERIAAAYKNTRAYVNFIKETLPTAKINFVSEALAAEGFTPSVFSLDLPTKGDTAEEKEAHKRELNQRLIDKMIGEIPNESKYCVSYGQLKGCYWTIPATSTQGTTKEGDKDYIVRVALSPALDLEQHKKIFTDFVNTLS
jgi:cystathionine beta-lyase/cystathionine gamma-synthase